MKSVSSRDFNQDLSGAKRAALEGPVFITDRGKPSFVLLSIDEYQAMTGGGQSVQQAFAHLPKTDALDREFPPAMGNLPRAADLSD